MARAFIAVELAPAVHILLESLQTRLQSEIGNRWVRWVRPDGIHLTLKFLGDVDASRLKEVSRALQAETPSHPRCDYTVGGLGAFPNASRARVIWVGLEDPEACLHRLHTGIEAAMARLGFREEPRDFHPHLTLGRVRDDIGREQALAIGRALTGQAPWKPLASVSNEVCLVRSDLRPEGAVYTMLSRHPLGGSSP